MTWIERFYFFFTVGGQREKGKDYLLYNQNGSKSNVKFSGNLLKKKENLKYDRLIWQI